MSSVAARITQGFYYLGLGVWLGAIVMSAISAAMAFKTVPKYQPTLNAPKFNSPELAPRADRILAGAVAGAGFRGLTVVQSICAVVVVVCVVLQVVIFHSGAGAANILRLALVAVPVVILIIDQVAVQPRIERQLKVMYEPAEPATVRTDAEVTFRRFHTASTRLLSAAALALAAAIVVSPLALQPKGAPSRTPVGLESSE